MSAKLVEIDFEELNNLVDQVLKKMHLDATERDIISSVLMYAEMRGKSQGLIKLIEKTVVPAADRTPIVVEQKTPSIHFIQGNGNSGMVVLDRAAEETIRACAQTGLALTGTCGTASSTGSIGYYAHKIAAAGFVGVVMAGSPKVMAVKGSLKRALGTNPLAIAIPTGGEPLVLDMATSATTWFDMLRCQREGGQLPEDVALDRNGNPTTDPAEALQGVMLTFAGAKGSGLALMIEILTGPLMGASIVDEPTDRRGNFLLAINPVVFADDFISKVDTLVNAIKTGSRQAGVDTIRLPGEQSFQVASNQRTSGLVKINQEILNELRRGAESH